MKTSFKLLLLSTLTAVNSIGADIAPSSSISSFKCTPFYRSGKVSKISFYVKASRTNKTSITIDIINDLYPNGIKIYSKIFTTSETVNVSYNNNYTRSSGNTLRVTEKLSDTTKIIQHEIEVAESNTTVINDSIFEFNSSSYFYSYSNNLWQRKKEKTIFYNFEDQYMPNYYHQIDISNFQVDLNQSFNSASVSCDNAVFAITNINGIFDSFEHDADFAYIPLTFEKKNSIFVLKFKNDIYVNPLTLKMSAYAELGFVKTAHFYLPRNEKRNENTYNCYISFEGMGIDKSNFLASFKYKSLLNTFGDCRNSEYCIVNS